MYSETGTIGANKLFFLAASYICIDGEQHKFHPIYYIDENEKGTLSLL